MKKRLIKINGKIYPFENIFGFITKEEILKEGYKDNSPSPNKPKSLIEIVWMVFFGTMYVVMLFILAGLLSDATKNKD